jgi:hypothetical protein
MRGLLTPLVIVRRFLLGILALVGRVLIVGLGVGCVLVGGLLGLLGVGGFWGGRLLLFGMLLLARGLF